MPVAPQIWRVLWHDNEMTHPWFDERLASGADVRLASLIGLNRVDELIVKLTEERQRIDRCCTTCCLCLTFHQAMVRPRPANSARCLERTADTHSPDGITVAP